MSNIMGLSPREAAEAAGLGLTKLYEEIGAGRLRAKKVGRRTVITVEDLRAWMNALPELRAA